MNIRNANAALQRSFFAVCLLCPAPVLAEDLKPEGGAEQALPAENSTTDELPLEGDLDLGDDLDLGGNAGKVDFGWTTAGGGYTDPTSLFSFHGYVDGVFAGASRDWLANDPTQLSRPGQLLVPNTNESSFQLDAALFFSSEPTEQHRIMIEAHLVSDPSGVGAAGPGGVTLALTEATVAWDVLGEYLSVASGVYWAPFGVVSEDWLGAQSRFTLIPRAAGAFPAHYNERGVRINGSVAFTERFGINYVASIGNGVQSFGIDGQSAFDGDSSRSLIGRIGVFPGLGTALELGYSVYAGIQRDEADLNLLVADVKRYESSVVAHGIDAHLKLGPAELRGYYIYSSEVLKGDPDIAPPTLSREGLMVEAVYEFSIESSWVSGLSPKARVDWVQRELLGDDGESSSDAQTAVYSVGLNFFPGGQLLSFDTYPQRNIYLSLEYHFQSELEREELDNDRFIARFTGRF